MSEMLNRVKDFKERRPKILNLELLSLKTDFGKGVKPQNPRWVDQLEENHMDFSKSAHRNDTRSDLTAT